jgi:hypothetical protein
MALGRVIAAAWLGFGEPEIPPATPEVEPAAAAVEPRVVSGGRVQWEAPSQCASQADVADEIGRRVDGQAFELRARVVAQGEGLVADVEITTARGLVRRTLESPRCDTIVDAVVLLVVVATDPVPTLGSITPRLRGPAPVEPVTVPAIEAVPPVAPAARDVPAPPPKRERSLHARLSAAAVVGAGMLPVLDVGVRGAIGFVSPRVHADVTATYLAPRELVRDDVSVRLDAWSLGARVCPVVPLPSSALELSICGGVAAGQLRGRASGPRLVDAAPRVQPWVGVAAGPELAIVVHPRVRLLFGAEAGGAPVRPGFGIGGLGRVWRPRPWLARGQIGLEVRL